MIFTWWRFCSRKQVPGLKATRADNSVPPIPAAVVTVNHGRTALAVIAVAAAAIAATTHIRPSDISQYINLSWVRGAPYFGFRYYVRTGQNLLSSC